MKKLQIILTGLLVLQSVIMLTVFLMNQQSMKQSLQPLLLEFDSQAVDAITIKEAENTIGFIKIDDQWQLENEHNLPADNVRVSQLLTKLNQLSIDWPVATTPSSHVRFDVDENKFQRHIQVYQGNERLANMYLGTSPGFRKVHVRNANDPEVYAVEFSLFDASMEENDWISKTLLAASNATQIKAPDYTLTKQSDVWQVEGSEAILSNNQIIDEDAINTLTTAFSTLRFLSIAGEDVGLDQLSSSTTFEVITDVAKWSYRFYKKDNKYYLSRHDRPERFEISSVVYNSIIGVTRSQFFKEDLSKTDDQTTDSSLTPIE